MARSFIPLDDLRVSSAGDAPQVPQQAIEASAAIDASEGWLERTSLFGDPDA